MNREIIKLILRDAEKEQHPDRVSCIHAALISVNQAIGKEMLRIRNMERSLEGKEIEKNRNGR